MALSITVTLYDGTTTVTLPAPTPDNEGPVNIPGVTHRTQGGSLVKYQVGPAWFEASLGFIALTNAQKNSLESFYRTNVGNSWTYTDASGNAFTAYFLDQQLPLHKTYGDWWECKLHVQLSAVLK